MLRCGFGQTDITPAVDGALRGSYRPRVMAGVHDRLLACACVIDDGRNPVALVGIDAGVIARETFLDACRQIAQRTPIAASNVIISASHTHRGGSTLTLFEAVADADYARLVARRVADAVAQAWENRAECAFAATSAAVGGFHFNRRFHMRDGRQATHPGKMNPDIVAPAGPVDEKINAIFFRNSAGELSGMVVHFGCHCTVTEDDDVYSADYVHYLREHLRQALGDIEIVFLLGACGDVTQIDNRSVEVQRGHAHADRMGAALARAIVGNVLMLDWQEVDACRAAQRTIAIPIREGDVSPLPAVGLGAGEFWERMFAKEGAQVAALRAKSPMIDCHITAIGLGDIAMVANGGELFVESSMEIQHASPFKKTWVVTLANEYVGYIPTADAHAGGGYEPRTARSSFLAVEGAGKIVEASVEALRALRAGG